MGNTIFMNIFRSRHALQMVSILTGAPGADVPFLVVLELTFAKELVPTPLPLVEEKIAVDRGQLQKVENVTQNYVSFLYYFSKG